MFNYNNLYTCGDQFLIECYYSPYKEFRPFLERDPSKDYSHESSSFGSIKYTMWNNQEDSRRIKHWDYRSEDIISSPEWDYALKKLTTWTAKKLKDNYQDVEVVPAISWMMEYLEGGWQSVHSHGRNCITQVLHMDGNYQLSADESKKERVHGSMFAFMTDGNPPFYKAFPPTPGKCLIMKGDVFHGVYPTKELPRRCIVVDYLVLK
jgi:hypothetical protein